LNWIRLQVFFSLPTSTVSPVAAGALINLLSEISARTKYIDRLEEQIDAAASLSILYFEKAAFSAAFGIAQKHVAQSKYSGTYVNIARTFLSNVSPFYPRELNIIGPKATQLLDSMYSEQTKRIADLLHEASLTVRDFTLRSEPEQGATAAASKDKGGRKSSVVTDGESNAPGAESFMRPNTEIKKLNGRKQLVKNLSITICAEDTVTFYDTVFHPRQFLLEAIYNKVRRCLFFFLPFLAFLLRRCLFNFTLSCAQLHCQRDQGGSFGRRRFCHSCQASFSRPG